MTSLHKLIMVVATFAMIVTLPAGRAFAQQKAETTRTAKPDASELQIVIHVSDTTDQISMESIQTELQSVADVRHVGVDFPAHAITVRWINPVLTVPKVVSVLAGLGISGHAIVPTCRANGQAQTTEARRGAQPGARIDLGNVELQCLDHHEARRFCEQYLDEVIPDGIELDKCHIIRVDFQVTSQADRGVDWMSRATLVDRDGAPVKPLAWLQLPESPGDINRKLTGLLIFPKIPLLNIGLTLRLLRSNGAGYDSFTIDVPRKK